jgi:uncharacterized protein YndB with AHSA1/START domain
MKLGQLDRTPDGQPQLRFTRRLQHAPDKVWRALTEPQHLEAWFPQRIEGRWEVGAVLEFVSGEPREVAMKGEVIVVDRPRVLAFTWGTDTLRFELEADGDGTILTLTDTFDDIGKAARDAAGWHECLDRLEIELGGERPAGKPGQVWARVHPQYVASFGAEAATIGPPEGWQPEE